MSTTAIVFPFDLFGSPGTSNGARLLGDLVEEIIEDTEDEEGESRADAFRGELQIREFTFDSMDEVENWRDAGQVELERAVPDGFVLWFGGNHLSVLPVLEFLGDENPEEVLIIQFDAHLDIYAFHDNQEELNHGNYLRHPDVKPLPRIVNVGHRDLFLTQTQIAEVFEAVFSAEQVFVDPTGVVEELKKLVASAKRVWIDIDADVFDPAAMPAVTAPLPFGLTSQSFLMLMNAVWSDAVIGVSISEFAPDRDVRDTGLGLLGWLVEWVLLKKHESDRA